MREFVRAVVLAVLVFLVANDVKEILTSLSTSTSLKPVVDWMYPISKSSYRYRTSRNKLLPSSRRAAGGGDEAGDELSSEAVMIGGTGAGPGSFYDENTIDAAMRNDASLNTAVNYNDNVMVNGGDQYQYHDSVGSSESAKFGQENSEKPILNPLQDPALEAVRKKLQAAGFITATGTGAGAETGATGDAEGSSSDGQTQSVATPEFTEEEKQQISVMKAHLTNVMQQWCLPKLVCELHASASDRGTLSEAELGLLSLIKETSLGTMGEVVSRYHFAAHMGQLLSGVDGNGCHNMYPNCPLSGSKVLQMVKKVRIR